MAHKPVSEWAIPMGGQVGREFVEGHVVESVKEEQEETPESPQWRTYTIHVWDGSTRKVTSIEPVEIDSGASEKELMARALEASAKGLRAMDHPGITGFRG